MDVPPQPSFHVEGNRLTLLDTGPRRIEALLGLIDGARESLRFLFYIYVDDAAGTRVRDALSAAAARGVRVSVIVDGLGASAADDAFFAPLEASGASLCRFIPRLGRKYLLRNHQKMVIADEARCIIGGFNIEDAYFGTPENRAWRDLGLLVEGQAARRLSGYFDALSIWAHRPKAPVRALTRLLRAWSEPTGKLRWLHGGPTRRLSPWARTIKREIRKARRVDILAAYFAPNPGMLRRLGRAAKRGSVRLVLPAVTDHQIAISASRFTYRGLLRRGVQVHEYQRTKFHTKLIVIDDVVHVGSANFDIRSLYLNLEVMLRVEDAAFAAHVRAYVDGEVADSLRITKTIDRARTRWWHRIVQFGAYFVMAVVDLNVSRRLTLGNEPEPPRLG